MYASTALAAPAPPRWLARGRAARPAPARRPARCLAPAESAARTSAAGSAPSAQPVAPGCCQRRAARPARATVALLEQISQLLARQRPAVVALRARVGRNPRRAGLALAAAAPPRRCRAACTPASVAPSQRTQTGTTSAGRASAVNPSGRLRDCVSATRGGPPSQRSVACTSGMPGWSTKLRIAARMSVALRRERVDEIVAGRVAVGVLGQVLAEPGAELVLAQELLEHARPPTPLL